VGRIWDEGRSFKRATETLRFADEMLAKANGDKTEAIVLAMAVMAVVIEKTAYDIPKGWIEESINDFPGVEACKRQAKEEAEE
jgi:hypothetical protein